MKSGSPASKAIWVDVKRRHMIQRLAPNGRMALLLTATLADEFTASAQPIEESIAMAREFREATQRGDALGLTTSELAFYDALANNESAARGKVAQPGTRHAAAPQVPAGHAGRGDPVGA